MRNERTCACTSWYGLKYRGLNLCVTGLIQNRAKGTDYFGAFKESLLYTLIYHQVNVTLTVTQVRVIKLVICHAVLVLYYRQRTQRLAEYCQFLGVNSDLTHLCAEHESLYPDKVTYVKEFLEHLVIHLLILLIGADVITGDINLNTAG